MKRKLLIVDDVRTNREILKKILADDYTILEAVDGREALGVMRAEGLELSAVLLDLIMPVMDGYEALAAMRADRTLTQIPVIVTTGSTDAGAEVKALSLGAYDYITKPYAADAIRHRIGNMIQLRETAAIANAAQRDDLTGLYNRKVFFEKAAKMIAEQEPGYYVLASFDVDNFKVINDLYGTGEGDRVLRAIADTFRRGFEPEGGLCCRINADDFAILYPRSFMASPKIAEIRREAADLHSALMPISFSIGRYIVDDPSLTVSAMYDRASLAEASVKGRYDTHVGLYDASMRESLLRAQGIVSKMKTALRDQEFEVWFQPQYNHATGALVGAEALVRWRRSDSGALIPPGDFIPIFERNGFIYEMDKFVWARCCADLRRWLDEGRTPVPVSVNVSRYDVFRPDFFETITGYVEQYRVPVTLLRLEITESAFAKATGQIVRMVKKLIDYGFVVEIDDFGSGYSSLNTLKDVPATILKLDMRFLEGTGDSARGGSILESIVRMAKWLGMSVVAEGVETIEQADYLKSIGCYYVQGYLYGKPMPVAEYEAMAKHHEKERALIRLETVENLDNNAFWDPNSMDTLIFNSYVGGACIFEYSKNRIEMLRMTDKYAEIIGSAGLSVEDALRINWLDYLDAADRARMTADLARSAETKGEVTGEYLFSDLPGCAHETYLRFSMRVIATVGDRYLVYCASEDLTAQRIAERKAREAVQREHSTARKLQNVLDNMSGGIAAIVRDGDALQLIFSNNRYYQIHGYTRASYRRKIQNVYDTIYPDDRELVAEAAREVRRTHKHARPEYRVVCEDGSVRWIRAQLSVTHFDGVSQSVILCVISDISAEKERDKQLHFLNEVAHDLMAQPEIDLAIEATLRKLMDYFKASRAYVFEFDEAKQVAVNTYEVCAPDAPPLRDDLESVPLSLIDPWRTAFESQGFCAVDDADAMMRDRGVGSLLVLPLQRGGRAIGLIVVGDPCRRQNQIGRILAVADYFAFMLTRRDLIARTVSDNAALTQMVQDMPGGYVKMRITGSAVEPIFINDEFCRLSGMSRDDCMALYARDAYAGVHPDDVSESMTTISEAIANRTTVSLRIRFADGRGGYVPMQVFYRVTEDSDGVLYLNGYYTDAALSDKLEEQRRALLDNLPCGACLYRVSERGIYAVYLNKRYRSFFDRQIGDLREAPMLDMVHPDDQPIVKAALREAIASNREGGCEARIADGKGGYIRFSITGSVLAHEDAAVLVCVAYTPITDDVFTYREMLPVLLSAVMRFTSNLAFAKDRDFRYICGSQPFLQSLGLRSENDLIGRTDYDLYDRDVADRFRREDEAMLRGDQPVIDREETHETPDGFLRYVSTSKYALRDADGHFVGFYGAGRDVTKEREKEAIYQRWARSFEGRDADMYAVFRCAINLDAPKLQRLIGMMPCGGVPIALIDYASALGEYARDYLFPDDRSAFEALVNIDALMAGLRQGIYAHVLEYREKLPEGEYLWLRLSIDLIEFEGSDVVDAYLMFENIDQEKRAALETKAQAQTDPLTGVLNRKEFADRMGRRIQHSVPGALFALLMLDLDGFKQVNDSFGHRAGDEILIDIGNRLVSSVRSSDLVGRLGGDEFVVCLCNVASKAAIGQKARQLCALLHQSFGREIQLSASVGIAVSPADGQDFETLYHKADVALYHVKGTGKDGFAFYEEGMRDEAPHPTAAIEAAVASRAEPKRRILIVEDNLINREMLADLFRDQFIVDMAEDGNAALARLRRYGAAISVVLLDLLMPGMDGFAVLARMREDEETRRIPVIVVSGLDEQETCLRAIRCGASDYVTKPVDVDLLRLRVQSAISKAENERLRAQNQTLSTLNDEVSLCRAILESEGTVWVLYDRKSGSFTYDPSISLRLAGKYDNRPIWSVMLEDGVADKADNGKLAGLIARIDAEESGKSDSVILSLRTPSGAVKPFRVTVIKRAEGLRHGGLLLTFTEITGMRR